MHAGAEPSRSNSRVPRPRASDRSTSHHAATRQLGDFMTTSDEPAADRRRQRAAPPRRNCQRKLMVGKHRRCTQSTVPKCHLLADTTTQQLTAGAGRLCGRAAGQLSPKQTAEPTSAGEGAAAGCKAVPCRARAAPTKLAHTAEPRAARECGARSRRSGSCRTLPV